MAGKSYIKVGTNDWDRIKKMYIKAAAQTWVAIRKAYVKTSSGWQKVFDTASNRPFISGNDIPKIRLNTFRTNSTYDPSGTANDPVNPVVEAPPVQQMGPPTTTPTTGWPNETIGNHLWGYDGTWVSGNGTSMTFQYRWFYRYSSNPNDDTEEFNATSSTGRTDMLTNSSTHLGQNDGDYFDRNFLTFKVTATNSAGSSTQPSTPVYIVRQRPTGTVTMVSPSEASPNTTMAATFTYSNSWYNKVDTAESYVEWFAVDNLGDTLTTSNRVQLEALNTFSPTGTTTKTATTYHYATLTNKYYYVRITLNNSNTLPAKYNGSIINISGFTPNSAFTVSANKTSKTASANGPFNLTNATKTSRFYDSGSGVFQRYVSVDIGQSSGATQYEVQIEGQYPGASGTYDTSFSASGWVPLQTLDAAPYVYESSRIGGSLIYTKAVTNYRNYRLTARSRNGTSLNGAAYSNNGTSSSYVYVTAPDVAPSAPSISNISTGTDSYGGAYIAFNVSQSSNGSNDWNYYEYSLNGGSWTQPTTGPSFGNGYINQSTGQIYVNAGTFYGIQIRLTNLDLATSSASNTLYITSASVPTAPTSVVTKSFAATQGTIFFVSGSNTQSVRGYLDYDSFNQFDSIQNYVNVSSNTAAKVLITGGNSSTRSYTPYLLPFSGVNESGNQGPLTSYTTKVLNGSDAMNATNFTLSSSSTSSLTIAWNGTGAVNKYRARLYQSSNNSLVEDKGYSLTSGSATFNGLSSGTAYYVVVDTRYEYTSSVYEDGNQGISSSFSTTSPNLTPPSIYAVSWPSTAGGPITVYFTGGSGPYYQIYWSPNDNYNSITTYDPTDQYTSSPLTDSTGPGYAGTWYVAVRSVSNPSNTGSGPSSTVSEWSGRYSANLSFAVIPSGGSVTLSGNSTAGSIITATTSGWSGSPTSYETYITTALSPNTPTSSSTRVAYSSSNSVTYTITSSDAISPVNVFRAFATASNSAGTSGTVQSSNVITTTQSGGGGGGSAPVLSSISGNNSLQFGGTFSWSFTNSPTSYSVFCQGPTGTVFTTNNAYTYGGTTFRPGYDGTGWQGAGNYTIYVSARNAYGDSPVASQTTFMN